MVDAPREELVGGLLDVLLHVEGDGIRGLRDANAQEVVQVRAEVGPFEVLCEGRCELLVHAVARTERDDVIHVYNHVEAPPFLVLLVEEARVVL